MTHPTHRVPASVPPQSPWSYPSAAYSPYPTAPYPTSQYPADPYLTAISATPHWVPDSSQPEYPTPHYQPPTEQQYPRQQQYAGLHESPTQPQPVDAATDVAQLARPARPAVLTTAVATGLVSCALVVTSQLLGLAGSRAAIQAAIDRQLSPADAVSGFAVAAADHAYATIANRAHISIGLAVVVALFLVLALQAGISTRVTAVVFMGLTATVTSFSISDVFPGMAIAIGALALLLIPVTTVLLFLPAVGRYRSARRASAATAA
jgi:hypothetical protein